MATGMGVSLRVTASCSQGGRRYMEDTFTVAYHPVGDGSVEYAYFGIFDGHGGEEASAFARIHLLNYIIGQEDFWSDEDSRIKKAIRRGFLDAHEAMWRDVCNWKKTPSGHTSTAGTTATICFVKKSKLYIGHVGDSGIVLGYKEKGEAEWRGKPLTKDHKPEDPDEYNRIQKCGGKVQIKAGICRVVWNRSRVSHHGPVTRSAPPCEEIPFLAVARSLGDLWSFNPSTDTYVVSPDPDVIVLPLNVSIHRCLIFGTDGVWNVVTPDAAVAVIQTCEINNSASVLLNGKPEHEFKKLGWINPARKLVDVALQRWSDNQMRADNTSVIAVMLDHPLDEAKENCHHIETNQNESVAVAHDADDTADSDRNADILFATPAEWVGPPPVATRVKQESSWAIIESSGDESADPAAVRDSSRLREDTVGHVVRDGETLCSDRVCLTIKDNHPIRRVETSLAAARTEEIEVCPVDENETDSTVKRHIPLFPVSYTAKLENYRADCQPTAENSSRSDAHCGAILEDSSLGLHHKSNKNHSNVADSGAQFENQQKTRSDHVTDRKVFSSPPLQQASWLRPSDDGQAINISPSQQRSRWSKHSLKNAERRRKRSLSDDRTVMSSYQVQKRNFKDQSKDVHKDPSYTSQQNNCSRLFSDTKVLSSASSVTQMNNKKHSGDHSFISSSAKEKRIRSKSYDRKGITSNKSLEDNCGRQTDTVHNVDFPQIQMRSTKRHMTDDQSLVTSSHQQKRRRNMSNNRSCITSVSQDHSFKTEVDEKSFVSSREQKTSESIVHQSDTLTRLRGRRSHSDDRKIVSPTLINKKNRRSRSLDVRAVASASVQDNTHTEYADGEQPFVSSVVQQKRKRGRSNDRTSFPSQQTNVSDEQALNLPCATHKGLRRSKSLDLKTVVPSVHHKKNFRRHSVASQSVTTPLVQQKKRWGQNSDRQTITVFPAQQKNCMSQSDTSQTVASLRGKIDTDSSKIGYVYGKQWSKRRKAPSTHIGQLRRSGAINRRRPAASIIAPSIYTQTQNSVFESCRLTVTPDRESGRILRSVTAAIVAESLPIAKKLRSSSSDVISQSRSECGLMWKKASEQSFMKQNKVLLKNVSSVHRCYFK